MLKKIGVESVKYPLYELSQIQYKTWPIMIWGLNILDPSKWNKIAVRFVVYMFIKSLKRPVGVEISPPFSATFPRVHSPKARNGIKAIATRRKGSKI